MRGAQTSDVLSPQNVFRRNIRTHSTPVNTSGANASQRTASANKNRARKRKANNSSNEVIDLTPKRSRVLSNDSDIEIVEPEPPTVIDLVDDTNNCDALTEVNATAADIAENVDSRENDKTISNDTVNVIVDSSNSTESIGKEEPDVEPVPLYIKDSTGGSSLKPPLYDLVSDDSFCFDSPMSSQNLSQNRTLTNNEDDSVVFVSQTFVRTPKRVPRAEDFISINNAGGKFQQKSKNLTQKKKAQKGR